MYVHYSNNPELRLKENYPYAPHYIKPWGLWVSDDSSQSWKEWCEREDFGLGAFRYLVEIKDESKLLWLKTEEDILAFNEEYSFNPYSDVKGYVAIEWSRVREEYLGIMIFPYHYGLRFCTEMLWYGGWDCASGCIWKPTEVLTIKPCPTWKVEGCDVSAVY